MEQLAYQERAIEDLLKAFKTLWTTGKHQLPLTLKAPTGSGKTYITCRFVLSLLAQPDWRRDVAFVWITFSDDLAMQSRDKMRDYFSPNIPGRLLTAADIENEDLKNGDILYLNWQKLVARNAEDRRLRRPSEGASHKEAGQYFEDLCEHCHAEGREVVLIVDESHKHMTTDLAKDSVIDTLNPRIILQVSATPKKIPTAEQVALCEAGFVSIAHNDVVVADMIKGAVVCQTADELAAHKGEDLDEVLLSLAKARRKQLVADFEKAGLRLNPLVLIQLPNDDSKSAAMGVRSKEDVVSEWLTAHGVEESHVARWFDKKKENLAGITRNDSPVDFLLFKEAAATGWDCPRAQILVMFREIKSATFHAQVIGRILRVPVRGVPATALLRTAYLYTNYRRNEVVLPDSDKTGNKPKVFTSVSRFSPDKHIIGPKLLTDFIPRIDYGDLGNAREFQRHLMASFDKFFDVDTSLPGSERFDRLRQRGLDLQAQPTTEMFVNAHFSNIDNLGFELQAHSTDTQMPLSRNDVEKLFTALCPALLLEQAGEETQVGNVARSWGVLKSALRLWLHQAISPDDDRCYRVFVADIWREGHSLFRQALKQTLESYQPILEDYKKRRREAACKRESKTFVIQPAYYFTDDYEAHEEFGRSLLRPFYIRKEYKGRENELAFARFLDDWDKVDWWMKNGDSGREYLAIVYQRENGEDALFYPDWIVRFNDNTYDLFDTKAGQTATSEETRRKTIALEQRIAQLNAWNRETIRYVGGIVVPQGGLWMVKSSAGASVAITKLIAHDA